MLPPQRQRTLTVISAVVTTVALAAYLVLAPGTAARVRSMVGLDGVTRQDSPGTPYAFLQVDPVTGDPIAWDRCRTIEYVVNPAGAPSGWPTLLDDAVARMERASGLTLDSLGETTDRDFEDRDPTGYSPDPVLVGWADAEEVPDLAGDVAGIAGAMSTGDNRGLRLRSGAMVLDSGLFADLEDDGRRDVAVAIVLHELGHVVGLDHVDDPGELMNAEGVAPRPRFGPGDLEGLAALADVPCD